MVLRLLQRLGSMRRKREADSKNNHEPDQPMDTSVGDAWRSLAEDLNDDLHASLDLRARQDWFLFLSVMSSYEGQIDKGTRLIV